ncbi:MAG: T9SS type A sorting domain-containing protein [Candidatus Kapaibacterium sp.]
MKFVYTLALLFILTHINTISREWEVIDNNTTIINPEGVEFHFKTFEMEELFGKFYAVNLVNTNGVLVSTDLGKSWEVSFYESLNSFGKSNIIYDLIKQGNQLYVPADNGTLHILDNKNNSWRKLPISIDFKTSAQYLQFVSDSVGYIGYHNSHAFYKTTDGGFSWSPFKKISKSIHKNFRFLNFVAVDENKLYMVGTVGDSLYFYKTTNSGDSWTSFESELFEESDLINHEYYNLTYEAPYFYVENRYKDEIVGRTSLMRSVDFIKWEPVFVSDFIDFGKFIHGIKFYGNQGFALGTQVFLYTSDGGDSWYDIYDENDSFYENRNPINGFIYYNGFIYAAGSKEEIDNQGHKIRVNKFFRFDMRNFTNVENEKLRVSLYPNPSESILYIESEDIINTYEIIDLTGKIHNRNQSQINDYRLNINIENLKSGTYFIRINERLYKRFVKK